MSIFSSLKQRHAKRLLRALRRGRRRRSGGATAATEALEQRALLSSVTYNPATEVAVFDADPGDINVVTVESPNSDTLVIRSQRRDATGATVSDQINLQGGAAGNSGFSLDSTQTVLTISINAAGSTLSDLTLNLFDGNDTLNLESTPATVSTDVSGGLGDDSFIVGVNTGSGFVMDDIRGDVSINGGTGDDDISLLDFESMTSDIVTFESDRVSGISPGDISYTNTESILVDVADRVRSTFNVLSTSSDVDSVVDLTFEDANGDAVAAIVTVGNTDASFGTDPGDLTPIGGDIQLLSNSGRLSLQVDNSSETNPDTVTVDADSISGFSDGTIRFNSGAVFDVLDIRAGSAGDSITLTDAPTGVDLFANAGDDTVVGSAFNDFVDGGLGDDSILAGLGDDAVLGFDGNDTIDGGGGADEILGQDGTDLLLGDSGDDSIDGGAANDTIRGGRGDDTIQGGFGDDLVDGDAHDDLLLGGDGDDTLRGDAGRDNIIGGLGDDVLRGGNGRDTFFWNLTDGNDDVDGQGPTGPGSGGVDRQIVIGTALNDVFTIDAAGGETVISEANGGTLSIGRGIEELRVETSTGDDQVTINDLTDGSVQRIVALGDAGNDRLDAQNIGAGVVSLNGGQGDDVLFGGPQGDTLRGGSGDDTMFGGQGADDLKGSNGSDLFLWSQGDGSDTVDGGDGGDRLDVTTNGGADTFHFADPASNDTIGIVNGATILMVSGEADLRMLDIDNVHLDTQAGQDTVTFDALENTRLKNVTADLSEGGDRFDGSGLVAPVDLRVLGGLGNDFLIGGPGADFIRGSFDRDTIRGGGGADELIGDAGADSIAGGSGHDRIEGGGGNDFIAGREGDDTINAGAGNDTIEGGEGDDFIGGGSGQDRITGGDGDDLVNAGTGADRISGGDGSDILIGGRGVDDITGNGDQDLLAAGQVNLTDGQLRLIGREWLSGNSYSDRVDNISGVGDENAGRNNGDAFLLPITSDRTIRDDENVDTLTGNAGRDLFFADFDSDIIEGRIQAEDQIDLR